MTLSKHKWYAPLILFLDCFSIVLWIVFLILSFKHSTTIWIKSFWILMEAISIFILCSHRKTFRHIVKKKSTIGGTSSDTDNEPT